MAFPSSSGTVPLTLEAGWELARTVATSIKNTCANINAQIAAGPVSSSQVVGLAAYFYSQLQVLNQVAAIGGIAAYAQAQINNASENIATDFSNMTAALQATINWIVANFPVDSSGYLQYQKYDANGNFVYLQFTSAQLSGLQTQLTSLAATIN